MSERGEVEVLLPLVRIPTREENSALLHQAFKEARRLIAPTGGRILGVSKTARAKSAQGELALRVTFAAVAPEGTWHQRKSHAT